MSRTISDLTAGTEIYIDEYIDGENVTHVPYIYLGLDASGKSRVLRRWSESTLMAMNSEDVAAYDGCSMDVWLNNSTDGFLSRLDSATQACLAPTSVAYVDYTDNANGEVKTIARRCFIPSMKEFGVSTSFEDGVSFVSALKTYYNTDNDNTARCVKDSSGTFRYFWLRSAESATNFKWFNGLDGHNSGTQVATKSNAYVALEILSINPSTPVSDEGAEQIALLPSGSTTSWGISATMSLGKSARRPKRCKLEVPMDEFDSVQFWVCNNYMDANPTWISCTNGGLATFGTTKTAVDWELGVKVIANDGAINKKIGEPRMIVDLAPAEVMER